MNSMHAFSTRISTVEWKKSFNWLRYSNCEAKGLLPLLVEGEHPDVVLFYWKSSTSMMSEFTSNCE